MFIIRAGFTDTLEIGASLEKVRELFSNPTNFAELMPNIERIHLDAKGVTLWTIAAKLPMVGTMRQTFGVRITENRLERIEWSPAIGETKNLLRYSAEFFTRNGNTRVAFSQYVELRRNSASELHALAGFAGETVVSNGMKEEIAAMIGIFAKRAKQKLEDSES